MSSAPIVSVVTPFYNTASYLPECIESVLAQTYGDFEYLLVNNVSTDGSDEIAARYAARDSRIRVVHNAHFVGQVENYNGALELAHPAARYVKLVQADDIVFPQCLAEMVAVGDRHPNVGLVASYHLEGTELLGRGVPFGKNAVPGRDAVRRILMEGLYPFSSPTTVLYRAPVVRARRPFYALGHPFEDTEAHVEILLEHELGFVHQLLSYMRVRDGSVIASARSFDATRLDHLILLERYGSSVLSSEELEQRLSFEWRSYLSVLGEGVLHARGEEFWEYHRRGLESIGRHLERRELVVPTLKQFARWALNPLELPERLKTRRRVQGH